MLLKQHIKETTKLSIPLIISQVGHVVTGIVDTIFLGHIGKTEQAAGVLANSLFVLLLVFSIGVSYSITPLVSTAHTNNNNEDKGYLLKNGLFLNALISIVLFSILFFMSPLLSYMGQSGDVVQMAIPFFNVLIFSIIPVSLFFVGKQYTEGLSNTKASMTISVVGNLLNILLNYCLINGYWGLPKMGYMGSCWATFYARCFMGLAFIFLIYKSKHFSEVIPYFKKARLSLIHIKQLLGIGIGSALQFTFEVAAFALTSIMIGWYGKEQIDAHGIAISLASFTYMLSSGISGAVCIRVSNFKAQSDLINLKRAAKAAFLITLIVMGTCALFFILLHNILPAAFTNDAEITRLTSTLLIIAGVFQLFDGTQIIAQGILRGMEDVKIPTFITLFAYWIISLPLAYYLGEMRQLKVEGIWYALTISLVVAAFGLFWRFYTISKTKS